MRKLNVFSSQHAALILLAAILAVVFFSYYPSLKNGFVFWDDDVHLYENVSVQTLDLEHIGDLFTSKVNKIYIPLTTLSFAVEYHFFKDNPFIYHLDNLLLHLGVVALVFWLGMRLGLSAAASGAAALLFGIHPMRVESVAWITERKDVLYAFFYMAALVSYSKYLDFTNSTPALQIKRNYGFLVLTVMLGILSMLAKPMALSLPLILLLMDWFHERKIGREAILEKIPLFAIIAGIAWLSYAAHARIPGKSIAEAPLIWIWTFVFYLRKFVFPAVSVPIYYLPQPVTLSHFEYLSAVMIFGFLAFVIFRWRKQDWLVFAMAFYLLSIFFLLRYDETPEGPNIVADRFMYMPSLGFCFLLGSWWARLMDSPKRRFLGLLILAMVAIVFSIKTYKQSQIWHDSVSLWEHQLKMFPDEPIALNNLAAALREDEEHKKAEKLYKKFLEIQPEGLAIDFSKEFMGEVAKIDRVKDLYAQAIKANPSFIDSYYNLGNLYRDIGEVSEAVATYKKTLTLDYGYKEAHFSLGELYLDAKDYQQAVFAFDQIIDMNPDDEDAYFEVISAYNKALKESPRSEECLKARQKAMNGFEGLVENRKPARATSFFNLGYAYSEMGDLLRAVSAYQMALDIDSNHGKTLYNLGNIYRDQGRWGQALEIYKKTVEADPSNSDAFLNMGAIYQRQGDQKRARENFQRAMRADVRNARAYFNLGYIEEKSGNFRGAIELYQRAIEFGPESKEAYYNLGNIFAHINKNSEAILWYLKAVEVSPDYMDAWINLSILSFHEKDFSKAVEYLDEAVILGYDAPEGYLRALEPYRKKKEEPGEAAL